MKQKKMYERPNMKVVKLKERPQLMAGSDPQATLNVTFEEEVWK